MTSTRGGAISPAFYRVYINNLPAQVRKESTEDTLEPLLCVKFVADDFFVAAKLARAMQACLNLCYKQVKKDLEEWATDK